MLSNFLIDLVAINTILALIQKTLPALKILNKVLNFFYSITLAKYIFLVYNNKNNNNFNHMHVFDRCNNPAIAHGVPQYGGGDNAGDVRRGATFRHILQLHHVYGRFVGRLNNPYPKLPPQARRHARNEQLG